MQLGGYFPNPHRFSYSELEYKRSNEMGTLSDMKSFILITDWLSFKGVAEPIHKNYVGSDRYPEMDTEKAILTEYVFPEIWEKGIAGTALNFNKLLPNPMPTGGYPRLLNIFGCRQKKATPEKVANAIYLIHGSSRYGPDCAARVKLQFKFWSVNNDFNVGIDKVSGSLTEIYGLKPI